MKKIFILLVTVSLFSFAFSQSALAIGQMTKPIVIKDVLRGQEILETLILFNSENKEVTYSLRADGPIASWATFYTVDDTNFKSPITKITVPAKSQVKAIVKLLVPNDAPNGDYKGQITLIAGDLSQQNNKKGDLNVMEAIGRSVLITVTDKEIVDLEVAVIPLQYGINKGETLKIKIDYYNKGNVSMKPDVQLKIKKERTSIFSAIFQYPESESPVAIKTRKSLSYVEWSASGQENGQYVAEVAIMHNGNTIAQKNFNFSIGKSIKSSNIWLAAISFVGGGNATLGWVVAALLLLGILFASNILIMRIISQKK